MAAVKQEYKDVLQAIRDELNNGQRKKLARNEKVKAAYERFGVELE